MSGSRIQHWYFGGQRLKDVEVVGLCREGGELTFATLVNRRSNLAYTFRVVMVDGDSAYLQMVPSQPFVPWREEMSVSLKWEPVDAGGYVKGANSNTVKALESAFGDLPLELSVQHLSVLRALAAAHGRKPNPFREIADLIEYEFNGRPIRIVAEY